MDALRTPYHGVINILRFNWHFYLIAIAMLLIIGLLKSFIDEAYLGLSSMLFIVVAVPAVISLMVSFYVYDLSNFYKLNWLNADNKSDSIINIHAGFDETSYLLVKKYPHSILQVYDFYNPVKHTEVSIKRARKAYPAFSNTLKISTNNFPAIDKSADKVFVILAAHEIRDELERTLFFKEINRVLKHGGEAIIVEHLRDLPNFLAYNLGFFHFLTKKLWLKSFVAAQFKIKEKVNITPFLTIYKLHHGIAP